MASFPFSFRPMAVAVAVACFAAHSAAQAQTSTVVITGRNAATPAVAGFGDAALARAPLQASSFSNQALADSGVATLGGLTRLDASVSDAYNAEGYFANLSVRGYALDNRFNYRRDGLPINAETAIALDNKERLELLKGSSGLQAGTSAPGGLVNLVVKRPAGTLRSMRLEARDTGSVLAAADLGQRWGADGAFAVRLNLAAEKLQASAKPSSGQRSLVAWAADWQVNPDSLLQAEMESSRQRQPSVVGFSLLGNSLPSARSINPRRNLNDQPWTQPVVLNGDTASLRWSQTLRGLGEGWRLTAQAMTQRLKNDDRTAFPYGAFNSDYECPQYCDRFAPDGTFTYWEYISNNERRRSNALAITLSGQAHTGKVLHRFEVGVLRSDYSARFDEQVFDIAGTGRIDGSLTAPPSQGFTDANTNRDERSTELFIRDMARLAPAWQAWAGLRSTQLDRQSERTSPAADGLRATAYGRSFTTPWLALAHELTPATLVYASWGQGLETDVVPNRARYTNAGQALPALKSRQLEIGIKHSAGDRDISVTAFDIQRPQAADSGRCDGNASCTRRIDGTANHRGVEAQATVQQTAWTWQASVLLLQARREGSTDASINGQRPSNVPARSLRLGAEYRPALAPGLAVLANVSAESRRQVLPGDPTVSIAGWQRLDLGLRWRTGVAQRPWVWRLAVDNVTDQRSWKESPYQFSHVYLYPMAPRTLRGSAQLTF